jgi:hypothetical protein
MYVCIRICTYIYTYIYIVRSVLNVSASLTATGAINGGSLTTGVRNGGSLTTVNAVSCGTISCSGNAGMGVLSPSCRHYV